MFFLCLTDPQEPPAPPPTRSIGCTPPSITKHKTAVSLFAVNMLLLGTYLFDGNEFVIDGATQSMGPAARAADQRRREAAPLPHRAKWCLYPLDPRGRKKAGGRGRPRGAAEVYAGGYTSRSQLAAAFRAPPTQVPSRMYVVCSLKAVTACTLLHVHLCSSPVPMEIDDDRRMEKGLE